MTRNNYKSLENIGSENILFNEISNFIDVQSSYSDFVTNAAILENGGEINGNFESGPQWQFQSIREVGLNVFYQVCIVRPRGEEFQISFPWRAQEVCEHCQGQGLVYSWNSDNSAYEGTVCEECGGEGCRAYDSEINLSIDNSISDQPSIRKRKAGRFNPRLGQRGDLIINITWVDELPPRGNTVN